jgi:hypothetical protein
MKKLPIFITVLSGCFAFAALAQTPSLKDEISTAHKHTQLAQGSSTLDTAHMHLHHVINCLVGPNGAGFDAAPGNPCKGQGNGAIPDSASDQAVQGQLQAALSAAQAGLQSDSLPAVKQEAAKAGAALEATPAQKAAGGYKW